MAGSGLQKWGNPVYIIKCVRPGPRNNPTKREFTNTLYIQTENLHNVKKNYLRIYAAI